MTANNYTEAYLEANPDIKQKGMELAQKEALEATFKDYSTLVATINRLKANSRVANFLISAIMLSILKTIKYERRQELWLHVILLKMHFVKS